MNSLDFKGLSDAQIGAKLQRLWDTDDVKTVVSELRTKSWYDRLSPRNQKRLVVQYLSGSAKTCPQCGRVMLKTLKYCSYTCRDNPDTMKLKEETSLKRYGVKHPSQCKAVRDKYQATVLERYGVTHYSQSEAFKDVVTGRTYPNARLKAVKTNLDRYGYVSPSQNPEIKAKIVKTNLERYGATAFTATAEGKERIQQTNFEHYGVSNPMQDQSIKAKAEQTNLKRYGCANPAQSDAVKGKIICTLKGRYGVPNISSASVKHFDTYNDAEYVRDNFVSQGCFNTKAYAEYYGVTVAMANRQHHKLLPEIPFQAGSSEAERLLFESIPVKGKISHDRNLIPPYELDIVIPEFKLAIEYNGAFWHSNRFKDKNYHLRKTQACHSKGYTLLHIFEFERQDIWASIIKAKLGLNQRIYARKCTVTELSASDARNFCVNNHLQGYANASVRLGLMYQGRVVQVMTFAKPRFNHSYDFELLRLCSLQGYTVIGGASKLLKAFTDAYHGSIITYADLRLSKGDVYQRLGFTLKGCTQPGYLYAGERILSRYQCQKHKLRHLSGYSDTKTEEQIMLEHGYHRVYDCGNLVYVKDYSTL